MALIMDLSVAGLLLPVAGGAGADTPPAPVVGAVAGTYPVPSIMDLSVAGLLLPVAGTDTPPVLDSGMLESVHDGVICNCRRTRWVVISPVFLLNSVCVNVSKFTTTGCQEFCSTIDWNK